MWLYYWLANAGIHPFDDVRTVVVPPPQMVMNMKIGNMSGFCVGEPWNQRAISDNIGFTAATSQQIWPFLCSCRKSCCEIRLHASSDGFLIVSRGDRFYICNPTTRKCASLPRPPLQSGFSNDEIVGFYRHQPSGEYRMLWASYSTNIRGELADYCGRTVGSVGPGRSQWRAG